MSGTVQADERLERPTGARGAGVDLAVVTDPGSAVAEAYRSLRATVKFANLQPPVRSVLIADAGTTGQHSETAANLAAALALGGDRTVLLDANLREPRLHGYFGLTNQDGAAEWLARADGGAPLPSIDTGLSNLMLTTAGHVPGGATGQAPADLLSSDACAILISRLAETAEFLIIDAPPMDRFGDALAIAARVDAVLLLIRSGRTRRVPAQRAKESLDRVGARLLGAVLTDARGSSLLD